jgi:protein involved in polysaccharide export with SLBB domain
MIHQSLRLILIGLLFLLSNSYLAAQTNTQQGTQGAEGVQGSGMTQERAIQELQKRGYTPQQIQQLQQQYQNQLESGKSSPVESNYDPEEATEREVPDAEETSSIDENLARGERLPQYERIYGQDLFARGNLTFAPNMNMPTPRNYVLGPGDEILIDIWGNSELNLRYKIVPDGHITVPGLGRLQLSGLTVEQAESRIRKEFASIYSDLDTPQPGTFLAISVGNVRTIKVNVMGEVARPGTYTLSSFASAFHALYAAGGINRIGSLRNIRVFRDGKTVATIDVYDYLMKGDNSADISLRDGDIVKVDPYGILAQITGEVKRPMWYEMLEHETLDDLIRYAGNFSSKAYTENLTLHRKDDNANVAFTVNFTQYPYFHLKNGDQVRVEPILSLFTNVVEIEGAVFRPGEYAISDRLKTVRDLVSIAQGTTGDAFLQRALLYRLNPDLTYSLIAVDLAAILEGSIPDIELVNNDRLVVPSVLRLDTDASVYIGGEVKSPGSYPYAESMKLQDVILRAGGFKEGSSTARIDVYRRIKDPQSTTVSEKSSLAYSFSLNEGLSIADSDFLLEPFDQIVVRRSPGYEEQQNVTITGEVLFGGQYAKLQKDERLSSLVERAGGLTPYAYVKGARLTRQMTAAEQRQAREALKLKLEADATNDEEKASLQEQLAQVDLSSRPVGIDLEKALKNPGGPDDIVLRDGDILRIPEFESTVRISGGVLYPNTVTFKKNKKLDYYIKQAGGYSRLAQKRNPYVVYMNGQVASGRWARIEPGCEIIVPERPEREPMSLQGILGLSTSLATIALVITNLLK